MALSIGQRAIYGALGTTVIVAVAASVAGLAVAIAFNPLTYVVGVALGLLAPRR